jgi:hypothetical protein
LLRVQLTVVSSSVKMLAVPNHYTNVAMLIVTVLSVVNIARCYLIRKKYNKAGKVRVT